MSYILDLRPHEIDFIHFSFVALHPPKSIFEERFDQEGIVASSDTILVHYRPVVSDIGRLVLRWAQCIVFAERGFWSSLSWFLVFGRDGYFCALA